MILPIKLFETSIVQKSYDSFCPKSSEWSSSFPYIHASTGYGPLILAKLINKICCYLICVSLKTNEIVIF